MSVILATWEVEIERTVVQGQPGQKVHKTLPQKYPPQKRTGREAPVVQCLPKRHKALSSNPSPPKKKKKKEKKRTLVMSQIVWVN
jgi:hypothetical protein